MPKIVCKLPNASTNINGVAFERVGEHVHSVDELTQEQLEYFASVTGFEVLDTDERLDDAPEAVEAPVDEASAASAAAQPVKRTGRPPRGIKAA
jgi:uncharacterized protein YgbK (DUF1537 family)